MAGFLSRFLDAASKRHKKAASGVTLTPSATAFVQRHLTEGTAADRKKLAELVSLLEGTPGGRYHLEAVASFKVGVQFDTRRGGAGYRPHRRRIFLNRMQTAARTATSFVHEATHARFHLTGTGADIQRDARNDFVRNMLREETECYFQEAYVGRQLLHEARRQGVSYWRQFNTAHELQMWFQLVHGVPYQRRPSEDVLAADAALDTDALEQLVEFIRPYFARYVDAYRGVESAKWDIRHGRRKPIENDVMTDLLSIAFDEQDTTRTYPRKPSGSLATLRRRAPNSVRGVGIVV